MLKGTTELVVNNSDKMNTVPLKFLLFQNYPNPFNPVTKIKHSIPFVEMHRDASLQVTSKVFDILGNEEATLVNEQQQAGNYEVEFSASDLTSGIYFYKLQAVKYFETKKMIILR